jgi:DNA-binding NarL/FixJ family response regulator
MPATVPPTSRTRPVPASVGERANKGTITAGPSPPAELLDGLTKRAAEILTLIAEGLTNPEIAERLFLGGDTIKTHINRMFTKTGSRDRMAAARYARDHHLA